MFLNKRILPLILFFLFCTINSFSSDLPQGANVVSGEVSLNYSQDALNINVKSDKVITEWESFSVGVNKTVNFNRDSSFVALNRVISQEPSKIFGAINAPNGKIFLVNPNGILFSESSRVNVAGLVASTLDISNEDFLAGNYNFRYTGKNSYIINKGIISTTQPGGYICLLSGAVKNSGIAIATLGTVVLASGEKTTLSLDDDGIVSVVVDEPVKELIFDSEGNKFKDAVNNSGEIKADGGKVILTAKVLNSVFDYAINNSGILEANNLENKDGVIELFAEGAPVINNGKITSTKVEVDVKNSDFINEGEIVSKDIDIKVEEKSAINKGKIIADGKAESPNGGKINIEAFELIQAGLISANAYEGGLAGRIVLISESKTSLDTGSSTEAKALGLIGIGGNILINSKKGNTYINTLATIDVSGGLISGDAGFVEISAFSQLGFYGILSGRAPPGYRGGIIFIDPYSSTIGPASFDDGTTTYYWTEEDITIKGDISLGKNATLYLLADHKSETPGDWDTVNRGSGAILNPSGYKISGGSQGDRKLYLYAGSGIGTVSFPILTENITDLTAILNPNAGSGGIYINQSGSRVLHINSASTRDGNIEITSTGSIEVNGKINAGRTVTLTTTEIDIKLNQEDAISAKNIIFRPANIDRNILIGGSDRPANTFTLTDNDLDSLSCTGTVSIGRADGTGVVEIKDINLSNSGSGKKNEDYNLVILGGKITVSGSIIMNTDKSITITSKGDLTVKKNITTTGAGTIALIADADEDGSGVLIFNTGITLTSSSAHYLQGTNTFEINTALLNYLTGGATALTIKSTGGDIIITASLFKSAGIDLRAAGDLKVRNNLIASFGDIILYADNDNRGIGNFSQADGTLINAGGDVLIKSKGDTTIKNVSAGDDIEVVINGNLTVGSIFALNNVNLNVSGSILDDLNDATYIQADNIYLTASQDIGDFDESISDLANMLKPMLDVKLGTKTLTATAGGNIYIAEYGKSNLNTSQYILNSIGSDKEIGLLNYTTNGDLTVNADLLSDDDIWLAAMGDVNVNYSFTTSNGYLGLHALGDINIAANISSAYKIEIDTYVDGNGSGSITQTSGTIGTGTQNLVLSSVKGINLNHTKVSYLEAENSASGDISIINTGDLSLEGITNNALGGKINISVNSDLNINSHITSYGDITLTASRNINQADTTTIDSNGGNIQLAADTDADGTGGITQIGTAQILSNGGDIEITAGTDAFTGGENILLGLVNAGSGDVFIGSGLGSILGNNRDSLNVIAYKLELWASGNIGKDVYHITDTGEVITDEDRTLYTQVDELYAFAEGDIGVILGPDETGNGEGYFDPGIFNTGNLLISEIEAGTPIYNNGEIIGVEGGRVAIQTASDITVGSITGPVLEDEDETVLPANVVGLVADGSIYGDGSVELDEDGNPLGANIIASILYLDASGNIGKDEEETDYTLYTQVEQLYAYADGDIGLILGPEETGSGEGYFDPGIFNTGNLLISEIEVGTPIYNDGEIIGVEGGRVAIQTASDITVGSITGPVLEDEDETVLPANVVGLVADGSIYGDRENEVNISASVLYLNASGNIGKDDNETDYTLYTQVDELYAFAEGDIGTIDYGIFDPGILNYGDLELVEVEANNIAIRAESDIYVGEVIGEVIGLEADGSILALIDDEGNNLSDIEASVLYLNASGNIGKDDNETDYTLYTQVDELYAFAGGDIGVILGPEETGNGEGYFDPGILNSGDLELVEVEANNIAIRAESDIYVGEVIGEVIGLEADGSILALIDDEGNNLSDIEASVLYLNASGNIGKDEEETDYTLYTNIDELYAYAGGLILLYDISEDGLTLIDVQGGLESEDDVYIYAEGDIHVGYVYDPLYVYLKSYNGSIIGTETEYANVKTETLEMYAANSIYGGYYPEEVEYGYLTTQISVLNARADILIKVYDIGTKIEDLGQPVTLNDVRTVGVDLSVDIVTQYDMVVGYVSDATDVNLTSVNGAIIDGNDVGEEMVNIITNQLTLSAKNGIGWDSINGSNALETEVSNLSATNTSGDINIINTGALNLVDLNFDGYSVKNNSGAISIIATSPLTVNADVVAGGDITLTTGEEPLLNTDDLTINANIISNNDNITLQAGDDIIQNSGTIQTQTSGNIISLIAAYKDSDGIGAIIQNSSGKIGIDSTSSSLWTNLVLSAIGGITLPNTDITNLQATNTSTGDIEITNTGNNAGIYTFGTGVVNKGTGDIKIISKNPVTIDSPVKAEKAGDIYIESIDDFQINNLISTSGEGKVTLIATGMNGYIELYNPNGKVIGGSEVVLQADTKITMYSDTSIENDGDISLTAGKDIKISKVFSSSSVGKITITTSTGAITDNNDIIGPPYVANPNIISNKLILSASTGIGSDDALETQVSNLSATNTSGDIRIDNTGNLFASSVVNSSGDVYLTVNLDLTLESVSGDNVYLTTNSGSIFASGSGPHITTLLDATINAPIGVVGTMANPINLSIGGNLALTAGSSLPPLVDGSVTVWNGGAYWPVSSNLIGVSGIINIIPATSLFPTILSFNPSGYVFFNAIELWPNLPPPSLSMTQFMLSQLNTRIIRGTLYYEILNNFRLTSVDVATPLFYAYHPLTPLDTSSFDGINLDTGAYDFIDGILNIKEEEKKKLKYYGQLS